MNRLLIIFSAVILVTAPVQARIDDPAYHHLDEVYQRIFALQDSFPQYIRVDSIGCSQQEKLPIYAVWIADDITNYNANNPAVVFNGAVHAEEVLGVEFCLWLMDRMVGSEGRNWRRKVNTYIIPTSNPEGLNVVYSLDYTYRKNKRDNIGDGAFRFRWAWGGDTSGVDINRNFPTYWIHGDKFLTGVGNELYDYYRGPAPASESETRALIAFFDQVKPLYAMTLHSSRTGNYAEKVIYP
ncbi:MAG: M14 family zinc carboxypeptidase, partial [Calditrichota bacterium]